MRRAAALAFRTTCQLTARRSLLARGYSRRVPSFFVPNSAASVGSSGKAIPHAGSRGPEHAGQLFSRTAPLLTLSPPLKSSMYIRRFSVAVISTLVGYGAYYTYKTTGAGNQHAIARSFGSSSSAAAAAGTASSPTIASTASGSAAAQQTRSVLVIGADELFTGTYVGEGPITKETDGEGRTVVEIITPDEATRALRRTEQSFLVNRGQGVVRYDLVQLPSNNPIEDDHAEKIIELPNRPDKPDDPLANGDWMFWGVYDGHSGWTTSAKLRQSLISVVARELNETYRASQSGQGPSPEAIDEAIKRGFTKLDDEIVHRSVEKVFKLGSKSSAAELLAPALSGSCALLSFYDSKSKLLRVACTGDSRAVLGRRSSGGKWSAVALSVDQTGATPEEEARLRREHPGEENVVRGGRVLGGLQPTRAFGDAQYKWPREISERLKRSFFARSPSPMLKTPPYVTAEPVITTTKIEPENGDFLVLATDGLWEMLTNEEVVGLVGKWIETQAPGLAGSAGSQFDSAWSKIFGSSNKALPVETDKSPKEEDIPIRLQQWGISANDKNRFVVKDKNVATHLIRNALGGRNDEQVCALLTLRAPFSRRYRDDLTVQVIFFGTGEKTGQVVPNVDATAPTAPAVKAKL